LRVLVVDDDPDVLAIIEEALAARGHEATGAGSADRARVRLAAKHFDLVLIDAPMLRLGGIALGAEVKAAGTPVLMLPSGADIVPRLTEAGLPYLLKPFDADELSRALDRLIARLSGASGPGG
jgi:DNA-binding response OmpR family regulator